MSADILYTMQMDSQRMENALTRLQLKYNKLNEKMKKSGTTSEKAGAKGEKAFGKLQQSAASFLGMYLGANGIHAAIQKSIELLREEEQMSFRALDAADRRAQGQLEVNAALPDATSDQKREFIAAITKLATDEGTDVGETLRESAKIVSATEGDIDSRMERVLILLANNLSQFRGDLGGLGDFAGSVEDIKKILGDRATDLEIQGLLSNLRSQGRVTTQEGLSNITQAIPAAAIIFGGDDKENIERGSAIVGALTSAIVDRTGELSRTATANFLTTLAKSDKLTELAGPNASLQQTLTALFDAPKNLQKDLFTEMAAKLSKGIKGRQFTKLVQESGLTADGFLAKKIQEFIPKVVFDEAPATSQIEFSKTGTPEIQAGRRRGQQTTEKENVEIANLASSIIEDALLGPSGAFNTANSFSERVSNLLQASKFRASRAVSGRDIEDNAESALSELRLKQRFAQSRIVMLGLQEGKEQELAAATAKNEALTTAIGRVEAVLQQYLEGQANQAKQNGEAASNNAKANAAQPGIHQEE